MFRIILLLSLFGFCFTFAKDKNVKTTPVEMVNNLQWTGQAGFQITSKELTVYIDPYMINNVKPADIIFITHSHGDHYSPNDIKKILQKNTIIVCPKTCEEIANEFDDMKTIFLNPGDNINIKGINCQAIPAYNIKKTNFHPKENNWLGYILNINGVKIYHAGDTEKIPEMQDYDCDIALLPLGQTYTMNSVEDAVQAAIDIKAEIAIPMHYGMYEGTSEDAQQFANLLKDKVKVIQLKMSE